MNLVSILKSFCKLYISSTAVIGALVTFYFLFGLFYREFVPESLAVPLENGFVYGDGSNPSIQEKVLYDEKGKVIIAGNLKELMISGTTVYGVRDIHPFDRRYFICSYLDDCTKSQDYSGVEFKTELERRKLPPYGGIRLKNQALLQTAEWIKIKLLGKKETLINASKEAY